MVKRKRYNLLLMVVVACSVLLALQNGAQAADQAAQCSIGPTMAGNFKYKPGRWCTEYPSTSVSISGVDEIDEEGDYVYSASGGTGPFTWTLLYGQGVTLEVSEDYPDIAIVRVATNACGGYRIEISDDCGNKHEIGARIKYAGRWTTNWCDSYSPCHATCVYTDCWGTVGDRQYFYIFSYPHIPSSWCYYCPIVDVIKCDPGYNPIGVPHAWYAKCWVCN